MKTYFFQEKARREGFGSVRDKNALRDGFRELPETRGPAEGGGRSGPEGRDSGGARMSRSRNGTSTGSLKSRRELMSKSEYNIENSKENSEFGHLRHITILNSLYNSRQILDESSFCINPSKADLAIPYKKNIFPSHLPLG